jgi:DNA-binding LacI/PurR family transcriptional regulator
VRILERDVAQQFQSSQHPFDVVHFDNEDGAAQAVAHLMFEGHLNIAFLGVHHPATPLLLSWSQQREDGWCQALEEAGLSPDGLAFRPQQSWEDLGHSGFPDETILVQGAVQQLCDALQSHNITSVLAANDVVGLVLIEELKRRQVPVGLWPSIVGFDGGEIASEWLLSSLRLPWEEAGAAAADLLWERRHGMSPDEPQSRWVRMRLIPRLTCRSGWVNSSQASPR